MNTRRHFNLHRKSTPRYRCRIDVLKTPKRRLMIASWRSQNSNFSKFKFQIRAIQYQLKITSPQK